MSATTRAKSQICTATLSTLCDLGEGGDFFFFKTDYDRSVLAVRERAIANMRRYITNYVRPRRVVQSLSFPDRARQAHTLRM